MNVAALLQDSPSDDLRRRQPQRERERDQQPAEQLPPPPPAQPALPPPQAQQHPQERQREREHERERDRTLQDPSPRQQQLPPLPHVSPVLHRHPRPPSPQGVHPGPYPYPPQEHGPPQRGPHLPPPSSFISEPYELKHQQRRSNPEGLQHAHELALHGPGNMVPPGAQAYILDHRQTNTLPSRGPPPPLIHPHSHPHSLQQQHHHAHAQSSSAFMPPPSRPHAGSGPPKLASPTGPGIAPSGSGLAHTHIQSHGSIPLFPTSVGPASASGRMRSPPPFEQQHIYGGLPRPRGGFDLRSETESPAMGCLPPPYDDRLRERDRDRERERDYDRSWERERELRGREREREREAGPGARGPRGAAPSQLGASPRSGSALSSTAATGSGTVPTTTARQPPPTNAMLSGPGAAGVINSGPAMGTLLRDRERERDRDRERAAAATGGSPESRRDRDRDRIAMKESERDEKRARERERDKEREYRERQREREEGSRPFVDGYTAADILEAEREREWRRQQQLHAQAQAQAREQGHQHVWSRFANPRAVEDERGFLHPDRERQRELIERERQRETFMEAEEARIREAREAEWDAEKTRAAPRARAGAKDKEQRGREKEGRKAARPAAREDQLDVREREAWAEAMEREQREMERAQREMERVQRERERDREREEADPLRAPRQNTSQPGHHHHHHSSSSSLSGTTASGHPLGSKPSKIAGGGPSMPVVSQTSIGSGIAPGDIPPQYGAMMHERQQQVSAQFRQGSSKILNGPGGPSSLSQVILPHQHQHPLQHQLQHPQHPLSGAHVPPHPHSHPHLAGLGFPHRRTPPPGFPGPLVPSSSAPPGSSLYSHLRTPSPRTVYTPTLPVQHLGTFVFPRTPFPYTAFAQPAADASELRDIRATLLFPGGLVPAQRPRRPRLWGGGLVPALAPAPAVFARPHPLELRAGRRVYTDDSDLFLCVLHAGWVSWSGAQRAREAGRDLRVEVRVTREARFVGGPGARYVKRGGPDDDGGAEDDGRSLLSAGWGNAHDGAGIEILTAEFVEPGTARSLGLRNRAQRLQEYAARLHALSPETAPPKKRRRLLSNPLLEFAELAIRSEHEREDAERATAKTVTFGGDKEWSEPWFKYHPCALQDALSPQHTSKSSSSSRKRPRSDPTFGSADNPEPDKLRAIIVETASEKFLISSDDRPPPSLPEDKENVADEAAAATAAAVSRRFTIALLEPGKEAERSADDPTQLSDAATPSKASRVLQRDIHPEDLQCTEHGITVLSSDIENGLRKGWKIAARRWKWA